MEYYAINTDPSLRHHGVKGQRWGVRRYTNPDGTLTDAGKKHAAKDLQKKLNKEEKKAAQFYAKAVAQQYASVYANQRYEKAMRKDNMKAAQKWLDRTMSSNKRVEDLNSKHLAAVAKQSKLMKQVMDDPNFVAYYKTGWTSPGSYKDNRAYKKQNGKPFYRETNFTPNEIRYDKTQVRAATDRNKQKASRKRQRENGYQLIRNEFYGY